MCVYMYISIYICVAYASTCICLYMHTCMHNYTQTYPESSSSEAPNPNAAARQPSTSGAHIQHAISGPRELSPQHMTQPQCLMRSDGRMVPQDETYALARVSTGLTVFWP